MKERGPLMVVVRPCTRNGKTTTRRRKVRQAHSPVPSDLLKRRRRKMFAFNFKKFLESGQYSDVEFAVKPVKFPVSKTFKAHRQLLALKNEVFAAMFYGQLPEKDVVVVTDLHPDGFYGLLKYLYTGKPKIKSTEEAMYTRTAADKYLVPHLALACSEYIRGHVTADDVCHVIDYTLLTGGEDVDGAVGRLLEERPEAVLASDAFTDCLEQTVHYVLDKVRNTQEIFVIQAVLRWARSYCKAGAMDFKTTIAAFLPKLRFLALSSSKFVELITSEDAQGVMGKEDAFAILCNLFLRGCTDLPEWVCRETRPRNFVIG
ncbi:BTB/POZ domain-containing protein 3-like isoform X2 [Dermacentor albipictus]|uniref:BTB/POZ domain-containing protein 3-like isoform X2 n=1 Tax=Dermacentor albipictus TaxID=60249 RepID=UPI0038FC26CE